MALRIFRRKPTPADSPQPLPPPAGDRVMPPAGDEPDEPAMTGGGDAGENVWSSGSHTSMGTAKTALGKRRPAGGSPRTGTRKTAKRSKRGTSAAKGKKSPNRSAKKATNRKPASKPARKARRAR
jgi:hypothetical protein